MTFGHLIALTPHPDEGDGLEPWLWVASVVVVVLLVAFFVATRWGDWRRRR